MNKPYTTDPNERKSGESATRLVTVNQLITYNLSRLTRLLAERAEIGGEEMTRDEAIRRLAVLDSLVPLVAFSHEMSALVASERQRYARHLEATAILVKPQPKSGGRIGGIEI